MYTFVVISLVAIGLGVGLGVGLTQSHSGSDQDNATNNGTKSALQDIKDTYQLPALAAGEGSSSGIFAFKAIGVRKEGNPTPAVATDIWHLGSNTKAMTATLLALLIQESGGKLSWTITLAEALPSFNISDVYRNVTVERLTSHRSGITDAVFKDRAYLLAMYDISALEGRRLLTQRVLSDAVSGDQEQYVYANMNYVIAGAIVDIFTNGSWEEAIQKRVFHPLNITTAGFGPVPESSDTSIDNPWPHTRSASGPKPVAVEQKYRDNPPFLNSAGRVHMAAADYNKFLLVHLDAAMGNTSSPASLNLTTDSFVKLHMPFPSSPNDPGYGYTYGGWIRRNYTDASEGFTLTHDGSNNMNYASVLVDSKAETSYMALTNVGGDGAAEATHKAWEEMRTGELVLWDEA